MLAWTKQIKRRIDLIRTDKMTFYLSSESQPINLFFLWNGVVFDIDGAGSIGAYCKVNTVNAALTLLVRCNLIRGLVKVR